MTRQWTAELIAAVAGPLMAAVIANDPDAEDVFDCCAADAAMLLDACADESERRAKVAAEEAVKR